MKAFIVMASMLVGCGAAWATGGGVKAEGCHRSVKAGEVSTQGPAPGTHDKRRGAWRAQPMKKRRIPRGGSVRHRTDA